MYQRMVKRGSRVKAECGIAIPSPTNPRELQAEIQLRIERGEIDVGKDIRPFQSTRIRINGESGELEEENTTHDGKLMSLRAIRERHLKKMAQMGLLRHTDYAGMTNQQLVDSAASIGSK